MNGKFAQQFALCATILILFFSSCGKNDYADEPMSRSTGSYSGKMLRDYFSLVCRISQTTQGFFPPQVARAYGYVGIASYEAVLPGIPNGISLAGQLNGLQHGDLPHTNPVLAYNWNIAGNAATAEIMRRMFEVNITNANLHSIDSMEQANLAEAGKNVSQSIIDRSVQYGKQVAAAVYHYSESDGGHHSYFDPFQLPFTLQPDPFCWVPTSATLHPISPYWGNNRPFLKSNVEQAKALPHEVFSTATGSEFYKQATQVLNQVRNNTPEQILIAKYWADDPFNTCTPAGHTFNILTQLLQNENASLAKTAVAYARLCIAENDAFITCWKGKYQYILIRPVSYIQKYIDPTFNTVIGTPPFPAYTSGHSCEMGAGSKIFIDLFTDGSGKYNFTDYSQLQYGFSARQYNNFNAMADECAASRFYGGIHYPMDNNEGLVVGRAVGDNVNKQIKWPHQVK